MRKELEGCIHLLVVSSIPVIYVNANLIEAVFGFLPGQQDLEDDFRDQWLARPRQPWLGRLTMRRPRNLLWKHPRCSYVLSIVLRNGSARWRVSMR